MNRKRIFRNPKNQVNNQARLNSKKDSIEELMNEVGRELGVDEQTERLQESPKQFAERLKREIQKRT